MTTNTNINTNGYTISSKEHLRNAALSLKAKGLMSIMLSMPKSWRHTIGGLSKLSGEGVSSVRSGLDELHAHGHILRLGKRRLISLPEKDLSKGYVVIQNSCLRDASLSINARGLLSMMLSLPDTWRFTAKGLNAICRDGVDTVCNALNELERRGYLVRRRIRRPDGRFGDMEYTICQMPVEKPLDEPTKAHTSYAPCAPAEPEHDEPCAVPVTAADACRIAKFPAPENIHHASEIPVLENPVLEKPERENRTLINNNILNTVNIEYQSIDHYDSYKENKYQEDFCGYDTFDELREGIRYNISADALAEDYSNSKAVEGIVDLIVETLVCKRKYIWVAGGRYPREVVVDRLMRLGYDHIAYVFDCLSNTCSDIRNIRAYMLTVLFNAISTYDAYVSAQVRRDFDGWCGGYTRRKSLSKDYAERDYKDNEFAIRDILSEDVEYDP